MRAKQLSKLLSGKVYLGGSSTKRLAPEQKEGLKQHLKRKKSVRAQSTIKDNEDDDDLPPLPAKEGTSAVKD